MNKTICITPVYTDYCFIENNIFDYNNLINN